MTYEQWDDHKAEYIQKAEKELNAADRVRYYAGVVCVCRGAISEEDGKRVNHLLAEFPDATAFVERENYEYSLTRTFSKAEDVISWFKQPLGKLEGEILKYSCFDNWRLPDQAQHLSEKTFDLAVWRPWLAEATVEAYAKDMYRRNCEGVNLGIREPAKK